MGRFDRHTWGHESRDAGPERRKRSRFETQPGEGLRGDDDHLGRLAGHITRGPVVQWAHRCFAFAQGVVEEVVCRGFVFRRLRVGRSFGRAATLSAVVFAVVHVSNLVKGVSPEILVGVAISTAFAFVLAFPLASLFERGGGSIIGGAVWLLGIDSINCFVHPSKLGTSMNVYLAGVVVACALVWFLGRKRRPSAPYQQ